MKKNIIYLSEEEQQKLNEYEREHKKVSYRTLLNKLNINVILCNNIVEVDEFLYDNIICGEVYNEEEDTYNEIYQYYIMDANEWDIENIKKHYSNEFIIAYSDKLDLYILMVDHFGTSWDYVLTDTTYTSDFEKVLKQHEEERANNEK